MTEQEILELHGRELDMAVAEFMEARPAPVTARELRERSRMEAWYSTHYTYSPGGWWKAEIGTDHNYDESGSVRLERDDAPVTWTAAKEPSADIADAWAVVEKLNIIVWPLGTGTYKAIKGGVKVYAKSAPLAICHAALIAVERGKR